MMLHENKVLRTVARIIQIIVALVFIVAATFKAFDPGAFVDQIREHAILPEYAPIAAWVFIIVEYVLAAGLLVNLNARVFAPGAMLLLLGFIVVVAYASITGVTSNCGCFGNLAHRTPEEVIVEDVLMMLGLGFSFLVLRRERLPFRGWKALMVVVAAVLAVGLTALSDRLPVDGIVTQLSEGKSFDEWPTESLYKDLNEGAHVVFLFSIHEPTIVADISVMNTIAQQEGVPSTVGLIIDGADQLTNLTFQYGPAFHVGAIEPRFAKTLYRKLPRTFILRDGVVQRVWSRIPTPRDVTDAFSRLDAG